MAITHIGTEFTSNFSGSSNSGTQNVPVPAGTQDGDLMFMVSYGSGAGINVQGTWTLLDSFSHTDGTIKVEVRYRVANNEPATYTVDSSNNTRGSAITVLRGQETSGIINDWGVTEYRGFDGSPLSAPNLTTTKDGCKVFSVIAARGDDIFEEHFSSSDTELADWGEDNGSTTRTCGLFFSGEKTSGFVSGLDISHTGGGTHFILFSIAVTPADDFVEAASDTISLSDTVVTDHRIATVLNLSDVETLNDEPVSSTSSHDALATDYINLSDSATASITLGEEFSENPSDIITLSETVSFTHNAVRGLADDLSLDDVVEDAHSIERLHSDKVQLSDTAATVVGQIASFQDTVSLSDITDSAQGFVLNLSDIVTLADLAQSNGDVTFNVSDTLSLSDGVAHTHTASRNFSDTDDLSDQIDSTVGQLEEAADILSISDDAVSLLTITLVLSDDVTLSDESSTASAFQVEADDTSTLRGSIDTTAVFTRTFDDDEGMSDFAVPDRDGDIHDFITLSDHFDYTHTKPDVSDQLGNYTTTLVVGPATIYVADFGATEPTGVDDPSPAVWTDIGGTSDGAELTVEQEYKEIELVQLPGKPARRLEKRGLTVKTNMAEPTIQNALYALNGGSIDPGSGYVAYTPLAVDRATKLDYRAVIIHGWAPGVTDGRHKRRVVIMRKCLSIENVSFGYHKEDQTVLGVTWGVHHVDETTPPFKIIDEE